MFCKDLDENLYVTDVKIRYQNTTILSNNFNFQEISFLHNLLENKIHLCSSQLISTKLNKMYVNKRENCKRTD